MSKWTERHMEIRTPYDIKSSITALGSLLACPHPALNAVVVRGKRVDTSTGIRTRARGVTQAEQWSQVPLRVKLVMLLADSYIEASTQGEGVEHGMGQWGGEEEEYDFDDDDEDDDDEDDDEENRSNAGQWDVKIYFCLDFKRNIFCIFDKKISFFGSGVGLIIYLSSFLLFSFLCRVWYAHECIR
jgi:hypothetical protein